MKQEPTVKPINLISYGSGDFYGGGSFLLIGMLFLIFLTDIVGISPAAAALVFSIGKVWDALSDPLMGYISDNTRSRFGRRRVYLLFGIVPVFISFLLLWLPLNFSMQTGAVIYYSFAYIFFSTVFTMVMVPYAALNAEMTMDYRTRTKLTGARIIFSQFSALLAGTIPKIIIDSYTRPFRGSAEKGYLVMAVIFALLYSLPWIFVFLGTWELPYTPEKLKKAGSPLRQILSVFRNFGTIFINKSFRIHILMYICAYSAMDVLMAMFAYFLKYNIGREDLFPVAMGSLLLAQILMLPVYVMISNRKGKGFAYRVGLSIWLAGLLLSLTITGQTPLALLVITCVIIGAGLSAGVMVPWAILPEVTDVDELITTKKRAGTYSGSMTLLRKLVQGLVAVPMVGIVLSLINFVPNQVQSPETLLQMKLFFVIGPAVFILLGIVTAFAFKITPYSHELLRKELKRLREGGAKDDADPETLKTAHMLTGMDYQELYRDKTVEKE
ncbi:MAG: glycoside-pentoside-hexuronide (GPH):cation symporter [Spirochaetaceae bacterium]|nr:glycoside-pentoside-hexuronide (GPH):cation symporter [Spirochaetaceae bacterium]MCF7949384.1 glycoside-pentoside-hexuronide (GPH):cation symporter [Spirochaetia bacterium]MCF7952156.1 glycoside-pentoside-hexuronide (GPH):cation symporter [Spirochaetaceae bacterium]